MTPPRPLPDFAIIGAPKAGTTSLYRYLAQHPEVYVTPVKEPRYFISPDRRPRYKGPGARQVLRDLVWRRAEYELLFEGRRPQHRVAGEASAAYLWAPAAPAAMADLIPHLRLVAILRQPADRAYSHFLHNRRRGREPCRTFAAALAAEPERARKSYSYNLLYADRGCYGTQLERYLRYFEREQLLVMLYDDLVMDAARVMAQICAHIGVAPFDFDLRTRHNTARVRARSRSVVRALGVETRIGRTLAEHTPKLVRAPVHRVLYRHLSSAERTIDPADRRALTDQLRGEIERTAAILDRDLAPWLADPTPTDG